jgi:hypothetical protein
MSCTDEIAGKSECSLIHCTWVGSYPSLTRVAPFKLDAIALILAKIFACQERFFVIHLPLTRVAQCPVFEFEFNLYSARVTRLRVLPLDDGKHQSRAHVAARRFRHDAILLTIW